MPGVIIPPVQPMSAVPKMTVNPTAQPGAGQAPNADQGMDQPIDPQNLLLLIGALTEALVSKGVIDEADIHNAVSTLEGNGSSDNDDDDDEPPVNRSQPSKDDAGKTGGKSQFGAQGDEHGKFGK